jgi:hypothetical protein
VGSPLLSNFPFSVLLRVDLSAAGGLAVPLPNRESAYVKTTADKRTPMHANSGSLAPVVSQWVPVDKIDEFIAKHSIRFDFNAYMESWR